MEPTDVLSFLQHESELHCLLPRYGSATIMNGARQEMLTAKRIRGSDGYDYMGYDTSGNVILKATGKNDANICLRLCICKVDGGLYIEAGGRHQGTAFGQGQCLKYDMGISDPNGKKICLMMTTITTAFSMMDVELQRQEDRRRR